MVSMASPPGVSAVRWQPDFERIPHSPGCYIYKDSSLPNAKILYIGKAKDLRKRVSQYFQRAIDQKTLAMLSRAQHVEWIATANEVEALLLEARLIRTHKPPFNIELKENTRYAYLQLTSEAYPRILTVRTVGSRAKDRKDLYGPFPDGTARVQLQQQARKLFGLRACVKMPRQVCLYYHLGQCSGPCEGKISKEEYLANVERARKLLRGESSSLVDDLRESMVVASAQRRFEEARRLRDAIRAVDASAARPIVAGIRGFDEHVIVSRSLADGTMVLVLRVERGLVTGTEEYRLERGTAPGLIDDFLKAYYLDRPIPDELILEHALEDGALGEFLTRLHDGKAISITVPKSGQRHALLEMALRNIAARIDEREHTLVALQEVLRLPFLPRRIDAFDNSHLQGKDLVSACVRFTDGKPEKSKYRRFIIRTVVGNDDFAAMREAVTRRYAQHKDDVPDLILIDGGKGQLSAAYEALGAIGIRVPIIGLAKREEEVFVPGLSVPLVIDRKSAPALLLQRIRDEIHRFVIAFHRLRRSKRQIAKAPV